MSLIPDEHAFAPATVAEVTPVVARHLAGARITSDCFDAFVTQSHGPDGSVSRATAFAIARDLRGGRDPDRSRPSDWHVRSLQPDVVVSDRGDHPRGRERAGTTIWLSRTYALPDGYDEGDVDGGAIAAAGHSPPL